MMDIYGWLFRNSVNNIESFEKDRHNVMVENFETGNRHSTVVYSGVRGNRLYKLLSCGDAG
jgi:hypothetical protein